MASAVESDKASLRFVWDRANLVQFSTVCETYQGRVIHRQGTFNRHLDFFEIFTANTGAEPLQFRVKIDKFSHIDREKPLEFTVFKEPESAARYNRLVLTLRQIQSLRLKAFFCPEESLTMHWFKDLETGVMTDRASEMGQREVKVEMPEAIVPGQKYCLTLSVEEFDLRAVLTQEEPDSIYEIDS